MPDMVIGDGQIESGDVVQVDPDYAANRYGGCLMIVTGVRNWGVEAVAIVPAMGGVRQAPYRLNFGTFARVGLAPWAFE
jgi:hypothetical protein